MELGRGRENMLTNRPITILIITPVTGSNVDILKPENESIWQIRQKKAGRQTNF